ncbi:cell envelope integrity protein TolA [Massilia psychrophila]|uniref:Protein TolA n=2 Tax=Massilia psychrophila TaxID=1603353 RepID=A0A2G8SWV9_9BURK|nr:cell envelope integrity protein TolA [Massilia psychrophila]PIL38254.1 protein TolA [Massilia psychrophila]
MTATAAAAAAATTGAPYRVPPEPSRWPSIALAAAMHAGLVAFLFIGVNWQNTEPVAVEAEVWDMQTQAAAPPLPTPPEAAEPAPVPALTPEPAPKIIEPPIDKPVAPKPPDIALERAKRKAEERLLLDQQRQQRQEQKKLEEAQLAKQEKAQKKAEQLAEKRAQELADKKAEDAEKKLADKKLAEKQAADKLAKAKSEAAEQAKLDKARLDEMRRITAGAGTSGEAAQSTASRIDTGYLASIVSKIKSTTSYPGSLDVPGNPKVVFKVEELPTGEIISVKLVKSSGIATFDEAVERGINKASPLPKKKDGTVARTVEVAFSMKDLN